MIMNFSKSSPNPLIQEKYREEPWKLLVCCIMLNLCTRAAINKVEERFFEKWPTPSDFLKSNSEEVKEIISSLGLFKMRDKHIRSLSEAWSKDSQKYVRGERSVREIKGIGKYATQSFEIFVLGKYIPSEEIADHALVSYMKWYEKEYEIKRD